MMDVVIGIGVFLLGIALLIVALVVLIRRASAQEVYGIDDD